MPPVPQSSLGASFSARPRASISLDALRAIAALLVLSDHTRHTLFVEYHQVLHHRLALFLPYLLTSTGHQAVLIFFVLSGFLVGGSIFRSLEHNRWAWKHYLTQRLTRLWLVLFPALCLVVLCDSVNIALQHHLPSYSGLVLHHLLGQNMQQTLTPRIFIANLAFLQQITLPGLIGGRLVPTLGTDGALWSLTNEFWYYILFPLGLLALRRHYSIANRILCALAFVLVACFIGKTIFLMFPAWLCGALLCTLPRPHLSARVRVAATAVYAVALLGCAAIVQQHSQLSDNLLTLVTTAYLWTLISTSTKPPHNTLWERVARRSASFSYTLYLVHMPMLYLLAGFLIHDTRWQPSLRGTLLAASLASTLLLYAWLIASLTEFRLDPFRNWVQTYLRNPFSSPIPSPVSAMPSSTFLAAFEGKPSAFPALPDTLMTE